MGERVQPDRQLVLPVEATLHECYCGQPVWIYPRGVKKNYDRAQTPHQCAFYPKKGAS